MSERPHDENGTSDDDSSAGEADGVDDAGLTDTAETDEVDDVGSTAPGEPADGEAGPRAELRKTKARLEAEADRAVTEFDQGVVDLLAWLLDTETRARIYVYLRQHPRSTSDEVADGTGLYPSTVREALAELHDEGTVSREKRESDGAGNNPYEYEAIAPSNLVRGVVGEVQRELNTVFNLEDRFERETEAGPVTITIGEDETRENESDEAAEETAMGAERAVGDEPADADGGPVTIEVEDADAGGEAGDDDAQEAGDVDDDTQEVDEGEDDTETR